VLPRPVASNTKLFPESTRQQIGPLVLAIALLAMVPRRDLWDGKRRRVGEKERIGLKTTD
jgi:hypothetical protein